VTVCDLQRTVSLLSSQGDRQNGRAESGLKVEALLDRSPTCVIDKGPPDHEEEVMKRFVRLSAAGFGLAMLFALPSSAGAAQRSTSCNGTLAAGTYHRVVVPSGATCTSDGPVTIKAGLFIESGATFVLGSEEAPGNTGTITGGVHAVHPRSVQIHFTTIRGGVDVRGGSGPFGGPFGVTWNAIEDNRISGGASVSGYNGFWFGFIRNDVRGSVNLNGNVLADPDGNEFVTNSIKGTLNCSGNSPAPQIGDSEGTPNRVTGRKTGQCTAV